MQFKLGNELGKAAFTKTANNKIDTFLVKKIGVITGMNTADHHGCRPIIPQLSGQGHYRVCFAGERGKTYDIG